MRGGGRAREVLAGMSFQPEMMTAKSAPFQAAGRLRVALREFC